MSNPPSSPLPESSSGDKFHSDVGDRSPPSLAIFSRYYRPSGEAIVGRMMRAYRARRDDASSSFDEEWLQNFFENEGRNVSAATRVHGKFHALRLRAERRCDYRRMLSSVLEEGGSGFYCNSGFSMHSLLAPSRPRALLIPEFRFCLLFAVSLCMALICLQPLDPAFLSLNPFSSFRHFEPITLPLLHFSEVYSCPCFEQVVLGLGTYAASRVEAEPPMAMCPFAIFPPVLAPVEAVKEEPKVSEESSTQTTAAYYPKFESTAQSENFKEVPVPADASPSVFCIFASSFPQELPRVVSEIIRPPSSSNRRGWLAMRGTFQQRESFSV
uniref:Uncharacterized protein n=1 Tax=Cannabis sativa TaxID=3483 RepID=A0A803PU67_CANSA